VSGEPIVSRDVRVGGRRLVVIDRFLSPRAAKGLHELASRRTYRLNDFDSDATAYSRHWKDEVPVEEAASSGLYAAIVDLARSLFPARGLVLNRIHYNLHQYGDVQFAHQDSSGDGVTALLFVNQRWEPSWMGETVFYEDETEPSVVVLPRPGRIAVFEGAILHRAGVAQRECFEPRISLALKMLARPSRRRGRGEGKRSTDVG